jgi:cell division septal protein FtsQ
MSRPERKLRGWARVARARQDAAAAVARTRARVAAVWTRVTTPPDVVGWWRRTRARAEAFARSRIARRCAIGVGAAAAIGLVGVIAASVPAVAAAVADHPYFSVTEIVVTPTQHVRAGALLEAADLRPGMSLWRVDPERLASALEAHPWVRRARVRREFPRRLIVDLIEREPVAILYLDQLYYVDSTGLAFVKVGDRDPLDLPFVTGIEAAIVTEDRPFARHGIRQALRLLHAMEASGLPFRVSEVHIERERGITVFPIEPRVALTFGWSGFGSKLSRLARVLRDFRGRESQIREVDLTMGTTVVVRLRQPAAKAKRARA